MNRFDLAVTLAMTVFCAGSAASHATPAGPMTNEQAAAAIMDYYPASTRAAGVEGSALLECHENEHARLVDCVVSGESPVGFGFGQAALTLAKLSRDNLDITKSPLMPHGLVQFTFKLRPPSIEPNTLLPLTNPLTATSPHFAERPNFAYLTYPAKASREHISGRVIIDCIVTKEGKLKACVAAQEVPKGFELGQAAIQFASTFKMKPQVVDGEPQDGAHVLIPISFAPRD